DAVQGVRAGEQLVELRDLLAPVRRRPLPDAASIRAAEVAVEVRPDLMAFAVAGLELEEQVADPRARALAAEALHEADVGRPRRMLRRQIGRAPLVAQEIDAAEEEGEARPGCPADGTPVAPEIGRPRPVERDGDELRSRRRRAAGRGRGRGAASKPCESSAAG